MALGETTVTMVGFVSSEPEFERVGEHSHELVTFWLCSIERRFDKGKRKWVDGRSLSVRVKCRRGLALAVRSALQKGDPVLVTGRMSNSEYTAEQGHPRSVPEVEAAAIGPNLMHCVAPIDREKMRRVRGAQGHGRWRPKALVEREVLNEVVEPVSAA